MREVATLIVVAAACGSGHRAPAPAARSNGPTFPGFSLALPTGRVSLETTSYASGQVVMVDLDHEGSWLSIRWAPGSIDPEDLPATVDTDRARGVTSNPSFIPGPNGSATPTVVTELAGGMIQHFSVLACGTRRVYVSMTGRDVAARHASLVQSFACHSDPSREPALGAIRVALDLPGFYTQPSGRLAGQLNLTDNRAINIILREVPPGGEDRFEPREELTWVRDVVLADPIGDRHPYTGLDGRDQIQGFVIEKTCKTFHVRLDAYTRIQSAARLETVVSALSAARCLDHDERPPTWPDAPAVSSTSAPRAAASGRSP